MRGRGRVEGCRGEEVGEMEDDSLKDKYHPHEELELKLTPSPAEGLHMLSL